MFQYIMKQDQVSQVIQLFYFYYRQQGMKGFFNKNKDIFNKQQIVNYEYQMIEQIIPEVKPTISNADKYTSWELQTKIMEVLGDQPHIIRWVGNNSQAYLQTYSYILLIGACYSKGNLLEFKHIVYKIGRECLNMAEQKLLVQFLCLIQYSRDRYSFLNKYPQVQMIFIKILQYIDEQHAKSDDSVPENSNNKAKVKKKNSTYKSKLSQLQFSGKIKQNKSSKENSMSLQLQYYKQLQQIYQFFNKYFSFITIQSSNEFSCTLKLFNRTTIYVIIEKECYFVVETLDKQKKESNKLFQNYEETRLLDIALEKMNPSIQAKLQFQSLFYNKNQVQVSNVIPIERGSQIRKHSTELILNSFYTLQHLNQRRKQKRTKHSIQQNEEEQSTQNVEKKGNDTFINDLVQNINDNNSKQSSKERSQNKKTYHTPTKHKKMLFKQELILKMKGILQTKEQLKKVRINIQNKIKKMDQNARPKNTNRSSEKIIKINSKDLLGKEKGMKRTNFVQQQIIKKFKLDMSKKERKTSYNSVDVLCFNNQNVHVQRNEEELPERTKMQRKDHETVQRMLSQKAISRPHSMIKSFQQELPKKRNIYGKSYNYLKNYNSNNLNVNVSVNINENLIRPSNKESLKLQNKNITAYTKTTVSPENYKHHYQKSDENKEVKLNTFNKKSIQNWMKNKGMNISAK